MDILTDIQETLSALEIPMETGMFADEAPDTYLVAVPLSDTFGLHADNAPGSGYPGSTHFAFLKAQLPKARSFAGTRRMATANTLGNPK